MNYQLQIISSTLVTYRVPLDSLAFLQWLCDRRNCLEY